MNDLTIGRAVAMEPSSESTGAGKEQSRAIAEIQSALTVAKRFPRSELAVVEKIKVACQRQRLAEAAEYSYSRGGTDIAGPSIRLLEVIAQHWGNIEYGSRTLRSNMSETEVECYAWDLETNTKRVMTLTVKHVRDTQNGQRPLIDARDILEHVANIASRRVRVCLENVIPRDIVDEARDVCRATLKAKVDITPEGIKKLLASFKKDHGVTQSQIETRIQRKVDAITPAQFLSMRRIFNSLTDGMSSVEDWFATEKKRSSIPVAPITLPVEPEAPEPVAAPGELLVLTRESVEFEFSQAKSVADVQTVLGDLISTTVEDIHEMIREVAELRKAAVR